MIIFECRGGFDLTRKNSLLDIVTDYLLFQFLIQADFLLVANREAVQHELPWNIKIRDEIPTAFVQAVHRFNNISEPEGLNLRYQWPSFLRHAESHIEFWDALPAQIVSVLKNEPILETRGGKFRAPKDVVFVPEEYRSEQEPLIDNISKRNSHLCFSYDQDGDLPRELENIGVRRMTPSNFRLEFEEWLSSAAASENNALESTSVQWRNQVAEVLWRTRNKQSRQLQKLRLVPLRTEQP